MGFFFRLFQIERLLSREMARGNQHAFHIVSRLRNDLDRILLELLKGKKK